MATPCWMRRGAERSTPGATGGNGYYTLPCERPATHRLVRGPNPVAVYICAEHALQHARQVAAGWWPSERALPIEGTP